MYGHLVSDTESKWILGTIPDLYIEDDQLAGENAFTTAAHENLYPKVEEQPLYLTHIRRLLSEQKPEATNPRNLWMLLANKSMQGLPTSASLEALASFRQPMDGRRDAYGEAGSEKAAPPYSSLRLWFRQLARSIKDERDDVLEVVDLTLARLKQLPDGWRGEDSVAPTAHTIADARKLLSMLTEKGVVRPIISASDDGSIHFNWRGGSKKASLRIEGDGRYGYALYVNGRYIPGEADGDLAADDIPVDLTRYLGEI